MRERKNEFGEREVAFRQRDVLLGVGQPTQSTSQRGLPFLGLCSLVCAGVQVSWDGPGPAAGVFLVSHCLVSLHSSCHSQYRLS